MLGACYKIRQLWSGKEPGPNWCDQFRLGKIKVGCLLTLTSQPPQNLLVFVCFQYPAFEERPLFDVSTCRVSGLIFATIFETVQFMVLTTFVKSKTDQSESRKAAKIYNSSISHAVGVKEISVYDLSRLIRCLCAQQYLNGAISEGRESLTRPACIRVDSSEYL